MGQLNPWTTLCPHRCCLPTNKVEYVDSGQVLCATSPANKTVSAVALRAQCTVMCSRGSQSPCQAVNYRHTAQLCELFHYEPCSFDLQPDCVNYVLQVIAKFHYTGQTGPDRTRTDFFAARVSEKLRWVRAGLRQSPCGSARVRSGTVGPV